MACFKPATPGFLTTLTATVLLVVVSFSVPYFKTVYFLQATYNNDGQNGLINFGTLGYCLVYNGNETCTSPSIGYEFNPNALLGNNTRLQIPNVVAKWLTYALFLHVIALGLAGVSALFGLLAHIREFSMSCFSSCISGAAAAICLIAFIFDLVLFFLVRTRVRAIDGASANIGIAVWLTLAAWILLFISGCMFGIGRCCIVNRPRGPRGSGKPDPEYSGGGAASGGNRVGNTVPTAGSNSTYAERMRMEAIQAEIDRKARQKAEREAGLPKFEEYEPETQPLTSDEEPPAGRSPYRDQPSPNRFGAAGAATGYAPAHAVPGQARRQASAVSSVSSNAGRGAGYGNGGGYAHDRHGAGTSEYNPSFPAPAGGYAQQPQSHAGYPPPRQASVHQERDIYQNAGLPASTAAGVAAGAAGSRNDYLSPSPDPHRRGDSYGHHTQASSYHSAYSHQQYPSQYTAHPQEPSAYYQPPGAFQAGSSSQAHSDPYSPGSAQSYNQYPPQQASRHDPYSTQSPPMPSPQLPQSSRAQDPSFPNPYSSPTPTPIPAPKPINTSSQVQFNNSDWATRQSPTRGGPRSPTSPTRLHGWREEEEPVSVGPAAGRALPPLPPSDAPPEYDPGDSPAAAASGYRNEKAVYRPA